MMRSRLSGLALGLALLFAPAMVLAQAAPTPQATEPEDLDLEDAAPSAEAGAEPAEVARDPSAANPAPADPTLRPVLEEFGGRDGLVALMDVFMDQLLADPRTHDFFAEADQKTIKAHLVEQFCVILGGDCSYTGRDMKTAHAGLGIERAHFNALVEDLQVAMDKRGIAFRAQNKLLAKLAPMHREVEQPTR